MPTKSKAKPKTDKDELEKVFQKESAASTDEFTWFPTKYGDYRIEGTRWGMYRSIDRDGNALVIGLREDGVHTMTPIHLFANSPDYDGSFDGTVRNNEAFVEL